MLKEQKVILEDPEVSDLIRITPPCRLATFEDEEKANLLSQLLKSNNPEDLQAANRLIKSMVRSVSLSLFLSSLYFKILSMNIRREKELRLTTSSTKDTDHRKQSIQIYLLTRTPLKNVK